MSARATWTADAAAKLCNLYAEGMTFAQVAAEFGSTRNAVIGKFNRLLDEGDRNALDAADKRAKGSTADAVAEWMAEHGGSVTECARSLGVSYLAARGAWWRVRARMGAQAI